MNSTTHSTIYALYPHATFESGLSLHLSCDGRNQDAPRTKYDERRWTRVQRVFKNELFRKPSRGGRAWQAFSLSPRRWLGDGLTLSIQLDEFSLFPRCDFDSWALESDPMNE